MAAEPIDRIDHSELAELCRWIAEHNEQDRRHCLHSWAGETPESLETDFSKGLDDSELIYLITRNEGRIDSAIGCELDLELGRGWLHGPHAQDEGWADRSASLLTQLQSMLPRDIRTLDVHLNRNNTRARDFYAERGFVEREVDTLTYRLSGDGPPAQGERLHLPIAGHQQPEFLELFEELFPATYYSGRRLLRMLGASHQIFVATAGAQVIGFVVVARDEVGGAGEVQFVGVRREHRGHGHGSSLVGTAIHWLRAVAGVSEIGLNVRADQNSARCLYESMGFRLRFAGKVLKKDLEAAA